MSADLLRRAAASMRERANSATPGVWKLWGMSVYADQDGTSDLDTAVHIADTTHEAGLRTFNAAHIASWHPAVALAVADWLDAEALYAETGTADPAPGALAVARAYLGEPS